MIKEGEGTGSYGGRRTWVDATIRPQNILAKKRSG